ncbi:MULTISPECIES: hypothetical protein [unclassified Streptomyces]|uniref:hypothetical protein n=1 Tax=unclassified Streptomyces TaxID=2593676 RepID=UPI00381E4B55
MPGGGTAADRSVSGGRGIITLASDVALVRFQRLVPTAIGDAEVRVRMSVSAVTTGTGAAMLPSVLLRYVDASIFYRARLHFGVSGALSVSVTRDVTQIGSAVSLPYTYTAGAEYEVRVRLTGHQVQMRVWPVGAMEPDSWHLTGTVTASPIAAGGIGVTASAFAAMTNASPQLRFDNFATSDPESPSARG